MFLNRKQSTTLANKASEVRGYWQHTDYTPAQIAQLLRVEEKFVIDVLNGREHPNVPPTLVGPVP